MPVVGDGDQVLGRDRPDPRGQLRAAQGDELVGVDLDLEAGGLRPPRPAVRCLLEGEDAVLAEDVEEMGQAAGPDLRAGLS